MSIHRNVIGDRQHALCDGEGESWAQRCPQNVIDLSPRSDEADRVVRTFFGWTSGSRGGHLCAECSAAAEPPVRRRRHRSVASGTLAGTRMNFHQTRGELP